tara:strand:+ start:47 stop:1831 length:1785 start_codon:yes stop_codon:yes gene_type:complete
MTTFGEKGRVNPRIITKNFFIIDIGTILYRNSNRKFMYANYTQNFGSSLIRGLRLRKDRVDVKRDPVYITTPHLKEKEFNGYSILSYCFEDQEQLNVGEYSYTIEMSIVDPLQGIVEGYVFDIRGNLLTKLQEAKEYLNNTREYDAIRQEITNTGKQKMNSILNNSALQQSFDSFLKLFKMLTGKKFGNVCSSIGMLDKIYLSDSPMSLVNSLIKVVEDVLFETSKYFEISAIIDSTTRLSPSSMIEVEYTFKELVDYGVKSKGLYDVIESRISGINMTRGQFINRMKIEGRKFNPSGYSDSQNLGYLTPNKFMDYDLKDLSESKDAFFSLFSLAVDGSENTNIIIDKALQNPENSNVPSHLLKQDHSTFESFASTLGLSVENKYKSFKKDSRMSVQGRAGNQLGIDYGTNSEKENNRDFLDTGVKDETRSQHKIDRESSILERRSKEEELISRFLDASDGYDVFRRKDLVQGNSLSSRFSPSTILPNLSQNTQSIPVFIRDNAREFMIRDASNIFQSLYNKLFINNICTVQYLDSVKDTTGNLVLHWTTITDFDNVPKNVLCRLIRFRSDELSIKDSYIIDKEIMSKYFYLTN